MTNQQLEQLDKYHSGQMTDTEIAQFEKLMEADPALKMESDFQGEIVNGLKHYRKSELKARLDAVNVGPTWFEFMGQSALVKSMGGVVVASLVGAGILYYGDQEVSDEGQVISIDAPTYNHEEYIWDLGSDKTVDQTIERELEQPLAKVKEDYQAEVEQSTINKTTANSEAIADKEFEPSFEAPSVTEVKDEDAFKSENLDELPEVAKDAKSKDPIDVETELTRSKTIKYKYYDGKLFLSGDFDQEPYEILEINNEEGRRIYVYYLGVYHQVSTTDKLIELPVVKDQSIINELDLLKDNK